MAVRYLCNLVQKNNSTMAENLVNVQEQLKVQKVLALPTGSALKPTALIYIPLHTKSARYPMPKKQDQFEYGSVLT